MQEKMLIWALTLVLAAGLCAEKRASSRPVRYWKGYSRSLGGQVFKYHSPRSSADSALLVRSVDSNRPVAWETESLPQDLEGESLEFVWMFGIDVNTDSRTFTLFVNDRFCLTFCNPKTIETRKWTVKGKKGEELTFNATMIDKYDDLMGYAVLKIPRALVLPGKPQKLKVAGETAGSRAWYMTFEASLEEDVGIRPVPAVIREGDQMKQILIFDFVHLGEKTDGVLELDTGQTESFTLDEGFTPLEVSVPAVTEPREMRASVHLKDGTVFEKSFSVKPVRHWTVYLVQHTHTDIGYTRTQSEILPEHLRFIDYALDFCDRTDGYPEDSRFRWTCESSWAVQEYLRRRPSRQVKRLVQRAAEGRIEVTALFANMSELPDENLLAAMLQPVRTIREAGIPVRTAMQNDVNGAAWCLVDYFDGAGINGLVMGEHGHRALIPFERPTPFWWESPSGKRILAFRAEHYHIANQWGIHTGYFPGFEKGLLRYLEDLAGKGYPFSRISLQYGGYLTDNSPPALAGCEMIRRWNEKYEWPRLRSATAGEFVEHIQKNHGTQIPVHRAAWPDWWTDGFGSAARETARARRLQSRAAACSTLLAAAKLRGAFLPDGINKRLERIHEALLFYGEHTFGAAESISDPDAANSVLQWGEKAAYVWEASKKLFLFEEEILGLMQGECPKAGVPVLTVYNTLNRTRSGLLEVSIDHEIIDPKKECRIIAEDGSVLEARPLESRSDVTKWAIWVEDVPPLGCRTFRIETGPGAAAAPKEEKFQGILENDFYRLEYLPGKGGASVLFDKELNKNLLDPSSFWNLGEFIYERLGNREQLESFTLNAYARTSWDDVRVENMVDGPIWKSLFLKGFAPACAASDGITCEVRLFHKTKRITLHYAMKKRPVREPEAVYVAFPFFLPLGRLVFEAQGGTVIPGLDQLEKTASDWNTIQNFAAVRGPEEQIVFVSPDIPLVQLGAINLGCFQAVSLPQSMHIYSWVLNNYWTTNFKASQSGEIRWSFVLTSGTETSNESAVRFGRESLVPFLARVLPPESGSEGPYAWSLWDGPAESLVLIAAGLSTDGDGVIFHLRETGGREVRLDEAALLKATGAVSLAEVNVLGNEIRSAKPAAVFGPHESKFLKVKTAVPEKKRGK
ncbi:MAG: hypothetical protein JXB26_00905 [Candidatus Aminicenantes bacterium]|nr:hypothetical protein [Candidatus Aminicenantes bacterium]